MLKTVARRLLPASMVRRLAFKRVYARGLWGKGEGRFYSGIGSRGKPVEVYVDAVAKEIGTPQTIVDLGCGDFTVGMALLSRFPEAAYIGCDIVPELIRHHQRSYASERVSFRIIDIVSDPIPSGDAHLVRQVFQHLSNGDILRTLEKLSSSPCLIVTEGQPLVRSGPVNPDKAAGGNTRFNTVTGEGAGVELDRPPFNRTIRELCRVQLDGSEQIVTWRVT